MTVRRARCFICTPTSAISPSPRSKTVCPRDRSTGLRSGAKSHSRRFNAPSDESIFGSLTPAHGGRAREEERCTSSRQRFSGPGADLRSDVQSLEPICPPIFYMTSAISCISSHGQSREVSEQAAGDAQRRKGQAKTLVFVLRRQDHRSATTWAHFDGSLSTFKFGHVFVISACLMEQAESTRRLLATPIIV